MIVKYETFICSVLNNITKDKYKKKISLLYLTSKNLYNLIY
jgi:hypothetical protein